MNFYFMALAWKQATVMVKTPPSSWHREPKDWTCGNFNHRKVRIKFQKGQYQRNRGSNSMNKPSISLANPWTMREQGRLKTAYCQGNRKTELRRELLPTAGKTKFVVWVWPSSLPAKTKMLTLFREIYRNSDSTIHRSSDNIHNVSDLKLLNM